MLRQNFTKVITSPNVYNRALRISYIVALLALIYLPFLPTMGEPGFISENAVSPTNPRSLYEIDRTMRIYKSLQDATSNNNSASLNFIENFLLKHNVQPNRVDFTVSGQNSNGATGKEKGTNVYGIYKTKRGDPAECNLITFSHELTSKNGDGKLEIALALSFLEMFVDTRKVNYNSRDLIFLAYDGRYRTYGKAIQEFLEDYYHDRTDNRERCGVIRQAVNIEIDQDDFNRIALLHQGINARVPDLDYYVLFNKLLDTYAGNVWEVTVNTTYENKLNAMIGREYYQKVGSVLKNIKPHLGRPIEATTTLYSLKGLLLGWPHDIHTYLLEKGILAVTLKGYKCETCRSLKSQKEMLDAFGKVIEGANRATMALQEQLHAASTAWIAISKKNVYFNFGGLLFVILLLLPFILQTLIAFYVQGLNNNAVRATVEHIALLLTMGVLHELPAMFEAGWSQITRQQVQICSPYDPASSAYNPSFLTGFLAAGFAIVLLGTVILPILLSKIYSPTGFEPYLTHQWNTKRGLFCGYIVINLICWGLSNLVFALIGTLFVVPIFLCLRPLQKISPKGVLGNVVAILWILGWGLLISHGLESVGFTWVSILSEILMRQACHGLDLYRFIVFSMIPSLVYIGQILSFRGKTPEQEHEHTD